jgi:hypothetical protein
LIFIVVCWIGGGLAGLGWLGLGWCPVGSHWNLLHRIRFPLRTAGNGSSRARQMPGR